MLRAQSSVTKQAMDEANDQHNRPVSPLLLALKKASEDLQTNPIYTLIYWNDTRPAIETLLELGIEAEPVLSSEPSLFKLSQSLGDFRTLFEKLEKLQGYGLKSLFYRQIIKYEISQIAHSIEAEIQSFTDRNIVNNLLTTLTKQASDDREKFEAMVQFRDRLSRGFDGCFQELVLRGRVFSALELVLCSESPTNRVRSQAALVVLALVEFNRNVFSGLVLMGPAVKALTSISSPCSIQVLCSLIELIKTPLLDSIEAGGEIPSIVELVGSDDILLGVAAMNVALEIAFLGSREAVEAMVVGERLVEKLMELQRRIESSTEVSDEESSEVRLNLAGGHCVARLAVQIEAREGLERREKREMRSEILRLVGEYSVSEAESATVVAEILWGSAP